jgi:hypothetical protein
MTTKNPYYLIRAVGVSSNSAFLFLYLSALYSDLRRSSRGKKALNGGITKEIVGVERILFRILFLPQRVLAWSQAHRPARVNQTAGSKLYADLWLPYRR